ncbi:hypothetical protein D5086_015945 [Populus alba]|uniref:Uncharacterized protein n=1 Tax=Populus alba TaxID=43335 RepID=A0ACC4BUN9_POPAL
MRKLCPNFDREDGLETVLEVPIPEEMFASNKHSYRSWQNMKAWMRPHSERSMATLFGGKNTEIQLLLGVVGAPLIPLQIRCDHQFVNCNIKDQPIEASMAKYIVQQYIAAVGGERALNSVDSMYAMGKVKMEASEFCAGEGSLNSNKVLRVKNQSHGGGEMGGFVLWQKRPDLWCLELVVSGCKISAGSDGKVAWRQTPWHHSHASRGPPRPLRRFLQLEDSHLLRIKASGNDSIFWETTMESAIQDYRTIDGINIAYKGRTSVSLFRFGETSESHSRTRMEEVWAIEEVDFNIKGLSMDCFLPPSDLKKEEEGCDNVVISNNARLPFKIRSASCRINASKVAAVDDVHDSDEDGQ